MVIRPRIRSFLAALSLYVLAAAFIGYFGVNAYTGNHGIRAKQTLDQRIAGLTLELDAARAERERWEHRVSLLRVRPHRPRSARGARAAAARIRRSPRRHDPDQASLRGSDPRFRRARIKLRDEAPRTPPEDLNGVRPENKRDEQARRQTGRRRPKNGSGERRPSAVPDLGKEAELKAYRDMLLIRRFEEKAGQMYGMGLIGGFCHLYIGQEAVVVGMQMALTPGDQVITGYRDHGHMLACGMDPKGVMAELTGRRGGYSKGKGGSMHMFSVEKGFYGGHGIVGAQVSLGTGIAFANRYRDNGKVCLTYFGDGAANQGQVYESFNMAELWKLPVIYVIENNRYAMGTSVVARLGADRFFQARRLLQHSRRAGRRHGRARRQGGGREGGEHGAATATARSSSR